MSLSQVLAFVSFVVAVLMYAFKWHNGVVTWQLFMLIGFVFLSLPAFGPTVVRLRSKSE